jgi:hypothetical protein
VIAAVNEIRKADSSISISAAMSTFGLPHFYYNRWKKACIDALEILSDEESRVTVHGDSRKLHPGRPGLLESEKESIAVTVDALRDNAIPVTTRRLALEAKKASPAFRTKSLAAQAAIIKRFVQRMGYSHRASTHVAQKSYKETELLSLMFMDKARTRIQYIPWELICNMDQTATPFCLNSKTTLQKKGTKTVHISTCASLLMLVSTGLSSVS